MNGFNFRDLIKPGEGARVALQRELEERRARWDRTGYLYWGAGDLLLQHGTTFNGQVIPEQYAHLTGPPTRCFNNALDAAGAAGLRLFEGVYSTGHSHFTPHAWCVDAGGGVVEVTYPTVDLDNHIARELLGIPGAKTLDPEHWVYCGVEVQPELYRWCLDEGDVGVPLMDRPPQDARYAQYGLDVSGSDEYPFMKVSYDPARTTLPTP